MAVKPIPEGYHTVTPYLVVKGAAGLINFLKQVFDAKEIEHMERPDGVIMHAEVRIGDSVVMLSDARVDKKPTTSLIYLYVNDTDGAYRRALQAGATSVMEPTNQFYGDRNAAVKDPTGTEWWIATHVEDVPPEEMAKRAAAAIKK